MRREGIITSMGSIPCFNCSYNFNGAFPIFLPRRLCHFPRYCQMDALLHPRKENVSSKIKTPILIYKVIGNIFSVVIIIIEN